MSSHILIVEDEDAIAEVLLAYAQRAGYTTHRIDHGADVLPYLRNNDVDLILLDLMLPDADGTVLCKAIRKFSSTPIIMVTARVSDIDRLTGLEIGADDYICKPFNAQEVMARVKAVLRRTHPETAEIVTVGKLLLYPALHAANYCGTDLDLTPKQFKILFLLAIQHGRILTRDAIIEQTYDTNQVVSDRSVDSHIKNIRKKLMQVSGDLDPIEGVYGVGYRLRLTSEQSTS